MATHQAAAPFPLEKKFDLSKVLHLMHGSLGLRSPHPKRHSDRFSRFCTAHARVQRTYRQCCNVCSNGLRLMLNMAMQLNYDVDTNSTVARYKVRFGYCLMNNSWLSHKNFLMLYVTATVL